jgi:two-component system, OmpR family, copper resistance phosphate regulon response regulator CusR
VGRILIVEDDVRISSFVQRGLRANGFSTLGASDGEHAVALARSPDIDLLILDLGLPGKDGFEVLKGLRERDRRMPVIIVTARSSVQDVVAGLDAGADDYLTKPFRFDELLARVRLRLQDSRASPPEVLRAGRCALDLVTRRLLVDGRSVQLTAREFSLAETLFRHPGQVLSRAQILSDVWGSTGDPGSNVLDVHVASLRKKIGEHHIVTVRGIGYALDPANGENGAHEPELGLGAES